MKQRYLPARFGYAALTALLALFAAAAPASANGCETEGNWRDGGQVTIRANAADAADGWKVTERKYTATRLDQDRTQPTNTKKETLALETGYQKLWGGRNLLKGIAHNPKVNRFETTFQAANGTTVACTVEFLGKDDSQSGVYKFAGASCSGPDATKDYVSCKRQYGAGVARFRVWLTLNDLE